MARRVCYPVGLLSRPAGEAAGVPAADLLPVPIIPPFPTSRPPSAQDFFGHFTGTVAAAVGATVILTPTGVTALSFPPGTEVVLTGVTVGVLASLATLNVSVAIRADGAAVAGLSSIVPWPVVAAVTVTELQPRTFFAAGVTLDAEVTNLAATGPWTVLVDLTGYSYPASDRLAVFG